MKKQIVHFLIVSALMVPVNSVHAMNYLTSAYQQAAKAAGTTWQAVKQKAQDVKAQSQELFQSIDCVQNRLGCTAVQMNRISDQLRTINLSLMPLLNLPANMASKLQKPLQFIKDKVNELQTTLQQAGTRFTQEQKAAFVSGAKKVALAAAALVAIIAVVAIGGAISGRERIPSIPSAITYDQMFITAVNNKDLASIRSYLAQHLSISESALQAGIAKIRSDKNYSAKEKSDLITELQIAIHNRQQFPEAFKNLPSIGAEDIPMPEDEDFIMYVTNKNISAIQTMLDENKPTVSVLERAEKIIASDTKYPNRNSLLGRIRQMINTKKFAAEFRASRRQG